MKTGEIGLIVNRGILFKMSIIMTLLLSLLVPSTGFAAESQAASGPEFDFSTPEHRAINVPVNKEIWVYFKESIQFGNKKIKLYDSKFDDVDVDLVINGRILIIKPVNPLASFTEHNLNISTGAVSNSSGNGNAQIFLSFTTSGAAGPYVTETSPRRGEMVSVDSIPSFTFDKQIVLGDKKAIFFGNLTTKKLIDYSIEVKGNVLYLKPKQKLDKDSTYRFGIYPGAVTDKNGIENDTYIVDFDTGENPDQPAASMKISVETKKTTKLKLSGGDSPYKVKSSDSKIASGTVSGSNLTIKGLKEGTADITITDSNGKEVIITVNVFDYVIKF